MYVLQNTNGLYLQAGKDYSFTPDSKEALTFFSKEEAERRSKELLRFGVKAVQVI